MWTDPLYVALPAAHPLAANTVLSLRDLTELPLRLAPRNNNPAFHDLVVDALKATGAEPLPGPPFTDLQQTLTAIGAGEPSWTVFYEVTTLPPIPRVAIRRLAEPALVTSLAVPPGPPTSAIRHLLNAIARTDPALPAAADEKSAADRSAALS
jgi:DNA-binding transcriptional LysR family regulator